MFEALVWAKSWESYVEEQASKPRTSYDLEMLDYILCLHFWDHAVDSHLSSMLKQFVSEKLCLL